MGNYPDRCGYCDELHPNCTCTPVEAKARLTKAGALAAINHRFNATAFRAERVMLTREEFAAICGEHDQAALDLAAHVLELLAQLDAAEQRVREVEAELARWNRTHIRLIDSDEPLEEAQARADANEKDAARYRYWRSTRIVSDDGFGGFSEKDIDAAIDQARLGAEGK